MVTLLKIILVSYRLYTLFLLKCTIARIALVYASPN